MRCRRECGGTASTAPPYMPALWLTPRQDTVCGRSGSSNSSPALIEAAPDSGAIILRIIYPFKRVDGLRVSDTTSPMAALTRPAGATPAGLTVHHPNIRRSLRRGCDVRRSNCVWGSTGHGAGRSGPRREVWLGVEDKLTHVSIYRYGTYCLVWSEDLQFGCLSSSTRRKGAEWRPPAGYI